jgi:hypothetical protein
MQYIVFFENFDFKNILKRDVCVDSEITYPISFLDFFFDEDSVSFLSFSLPQKRVPLNFEISFERTVGDNKDSQTQTHT